MAAADSLSQRAVMILQQHCLRCHNADKARGGLDLSTRDSALQGGATSDALVSHEPARSSLFTRAADGAMPPERDGRRLQGEELATLRNWILAGAEWPSLTAVSSPSVAIVPQVQSSAGCFTTNGDFSPSRFRWQPIKWRWQRLHR